MKKVLIIGSGIAGLSCAVSCAEKNMDVTLVSPFPSERSQSVLAAGGINAVTDSHEPGDSIECHIEDTLKGGCEIAGKEAVRGLCEAAPDIIKWLEKLGTVFSTETDGSVSKRAFGGQSYKRTCYCGASTGKQIVTALACETFLRDIKGDTVVLEPLKKHPTICDLVVDRGVIQENLKKANAYIGEYKGAKCAEYEHMYAAGKCLKCGLCLEVCPNYKDGRTFYGAAFANDCYLIASRSGSRENAIRDSYKTNFAKGCSKSLSCVDVCPMKIPTLASIAKMNRNKRG